MTIDDATAFNEDPVLRAATEIAVNEQLPPDAVERIAATMRRHRLDPSDRWLTEEEIAEQKQMGRDAVRLRCENGYWPSAENVGTERRKRFRVLESDVRRVERPQAILCAAAVPRL